MVHALTLIHGCIGLLREGWPMRRVGVEHLVGLFAEGAGRAGR
ncbi:hypothetical protein [Methylobacterium nodulans]|uniref:Uncharacterized protein n=1 Tax=Methylobacterium nodulans (strain LMG 21967 / CNCM I-2342 / ORS 2060) TaxID=460265 RepID=B8IJX2_METNO|nr:hypothetical protein [Methylobacterium nodulans]ACL59985.1 conserved hypothetical protein [Methylobacterium nodulans ORS 2060]